MHKSKPPVQWYRRIQYTGVYAKPKKKFQKEISNGSFSEAWNLEVWHHRKFNLRTYVEFYEIFCVILIFLQ